MPRYEYTCPAGERREIIAPFSESATPRQCEEHELPLARVYSVPVIHFPRRLYTQWSDVHDRSEKEMAKDPNIQRYDPNMAVHSGGSMRHPDRDKPIDLTKHLPKSAAEAEGASRRTLAPVEGEKDYA